MKSLICHGLRIRREDRSLLPLPGLLFPWRSLFDYRLPETTDKVAAGITLFPPTAPCCWNNTEPVHGSTKRPLCGKQGHESHFRKKCPQTSRSDCETEVLLCWAVFVVTRVSHMLMGHACDCCNSVQGLKPYFSELWTCVMKV